MVVILAAGKGSRMGLRDGVSKCSVTLPDGRSSVRRLIDQFINLGEKDFVVIVGYGAESVVKSVGNVTEASVCFVYNGNYDTRGCEYSLSCSAPILDINKDLIIVEGDLVTTASNLEAITQYHDNAVLVRPSSHLCDRSVAVVCSDDNRQVLKFLYDKCHTFDMKSLEKIVPQIYDSFQVWKISSGSSLVDFKYLLKLYKEFADDESSDKDYKFESGLLSINEFVTRHVMSTVLVPDPDKWINLNSKDDIDRLEKNNICSKFSPNS